MSGRVTGGELLLLRAGSPSCIWVCSSAWCRDRSGNSRFFQSELLLPSQSVPQRRQRRCSSMWSEASPLLPSAAVPSCLEQAVRGGPPIGPQSTHETLLLRIWELCRISRLSRSPVFILREHVSSKQSKCCKLCIRLQRISTCMCTSKYSSWARLVAPVYLYGYKMHTCTSCDKML